MFETTTVIAIAITPRATGLDTKDIAQVSVSWLFQRRAPYADTAPLARRAYETAL